MPLLPKLWNHLIRRRSGPAETDPWAFTKLYPAKILANFRILAEQHGLAASMDRRLPISAHAEPLPWYTYPMIEYLMRFDFSRSAVFEYGCGQSSLYWARRAARVWSVEHNPNWYEEMSAQRHPSQTFFLCPTRDDYARAIALPGVRFDLIAIDGVWRNDCAGAALPYLNAGGFILLDNADWYTDVACFLRGQGLLEISFSGFGPINDYSWTTSLFILTNTILQEGLADPNPIGGIRVSRQKNDELW